MQCPHCTVAFRDVELWQEFLIRKNSSHTMESRLDVTECPECQSPIVKLIRVNISEFTIVSERLLYPTSVARGFSGTGVPGELMQDYREACDVLVISPKASAAMSRRVLQLVLNGQGYPGRNLAAQIDNLLKETDPTKVLPSNIKSSVDAIRNFGNFSAHPINDATTLQVIDVEPHEAEWCLEIVERLFDHFYVAPAADAKRLADLNEKLSQAGKPAAKG